MTNLLVLIKSVIDEKLRWRNCSNFYIGKTDDFENRKIDHIQNQNENYTFCWELAYGTPKQISELENELISFYQSSEFKTILGMRIKEVQVIQKLTPFMLHLNTMILLIFMNCMMML